MPYGGHRHRSDSTVSSSRHISLDGGPELAAEVRHGAELRSRAHRKQVSSLSVNFRSTEVRMETAMRWRSLLPIVLLVGSFPAHSQPHPRLTITPPDTAEVSLVAYDTANHPNFTRLLQSGYGDRLRPFSLVLTNLSRQGIVGPTVRWNWVDQAGQKRTHNQTTDALFLYRPSLLPTGAQMLIAPGVFLQGALAQSGFVGPSADRAQRDVEELERSTSSSVTLDTIIFEDGRVVGPDQSETVASLAARKAAADKIVQAARQAKAAGNDVSAVLADIASRRPDSRNDHLRVWSSRIATEAQRSGDIDAFLSDLERIPAPRFHRGQ